MLLPPEELFSVDDGPPPPTGLVLVEMLDGFIDAGAARRLAREHLLSPGPGTVVASFDTDLLHDYRARRPPMMFVQDHWESYEAPALEIHTVNGARHLVLSAQYNAS